MKEERLNITRMVGAVLIVLGLVVIFTAPPLIDMPLLVEMPDGITELVITTDGAGLDTLISQPCNVTGGKWVVVPHLSGNTATTIWMWYDESGETYQQQLDVSLNTI